MNEPTPSPLRCLLILPRNFYSFANVLTRGLEALGFVTSVSNDEYPENLIGKIISKLGLPVSHSITRKILIRESLADKYYDLILVIKGRGLDRATMTLLQSHGRHVIGYHFDSFQFDSGPARWLGCLPRICTFDYRDANKYGLNLVELFTSLPVFAGNGDNRIRRYRVSAVLRNHSQRLAYLDRALKAIGPLPDGKIFIYVFEASALTFVANFLRQPLLYLKYWKVISRKPLPYDQYVEALASSDVTIDYAHPKQTGITIRCFEALSAGTRVITNNPWVLRSDHFSAENALVFGADSDASLLFKHVRNLPDQSPAKRWRTVDDFLRELIGSETLASLGPSSQTNINGTSAAS